MMLSRALSLAAVTLVVGCCAVDRAEAQENLDAGKSPSQLFSGTCSACHKSARGLLRTVAPGSLPGFLRQHYTTSPEMAGVLASYLISNGATDTRYGDKQRGARDGKPATRPDAGATRGEIDHAGHKRAFEAGKPAAAEGQSPQAVNEHGPDGRKVKQRLGKRGKPALEGEAPKAAEPPKEDATGGEPAKSDTAKVEPAKPEPAKPETTRPEPAKPELASPEPAKPESKPEAAKSGESAKPVESAVDNPAQSANADPAKEKVNEALPPSLRPDPVPAQTPAAAVAAPASSAAASSPPPAPAEPAGSPMSR